MTIAKTTGYRVVQRQDGGIGRYWWMIEFQGPKKNWVLVDSPRFNSRREAEQQIAAWLR